MVLYFLGRLIKNITINVDWCNSNTIGSCPIDISAILLSTQEIKVNNL
jgi:hypothetical protein